MTLEKLVTKKGNSYWDNNGAYQKEYGALYEKLVPNSGDAKTIHGELIRVCSRLFYDYCNNGNCNVTDIETHYETEYSDCECCYGTGYDHDNDECTECGGSGEYEYEEEYDGETFVTPYFKRMFDFLNDVMIDKESVAEVLDFVLGKSSCRFSDSEMLPYNNLVDSAIFQILTTENSTNPYYDSNE